MKKLPLVSIIIVNWNGGEVFKDCLISLSKIDYSNWELIVIDNGSTDGSEKFPQNYILGVKNYELIKNMENLGFAPANNQGYKKTKGRYILLLNNDTKVVPSFLTKLIERAESDSSVGVIQPKIFLMDKERYLDNAGSFLTNSGFLEHWGFMKRDSAEFNKEREIFSAKGACMLIRREVIEKVGLFDEDFVSYFEESDFCWRVWLAGWRVLFYPHTKIYHKVGMTSKRMNQIIINYHSFKNRIRSLVKNLDSVNLIIIFFPHLFLNLFLGIYYLIKLQFDKAKMIFSAILWNITNLPPTLELRRRIQEKRTRSDKEIFQKVMSTASWREMLSHFRKVEANF